MDLSSGKLLWPAITRLPRPGIPLKADAAADVLVVGAGITGALVADLLTESGAKVIIIDRRKAASGSTAASTALVNAELDVPLSTLAGSLGQECARRAYRAAYDALTHWHHQVHGHETTCALMKRQSLYLAAKDEDLGALEVETAARLSAGLPASFLSRTNLRDQFGLDRPAAILTPTALEVNPVATTMLLLCRAIDRGAAFHPRTDATLASISAGAPPYVIPTSAGSTITADWIVVATGYEAPEEFAILRPLTRLKSTYALATAPLPSPPWNDSAILWDSGHPYLYARTSADGRAIIGGEDEDFADPEQRDALIPSKCRTLQAKLGELSPAAGSGSPEFCWAGTFGESIDGLPFIGPHPRWHNILFSLGYGGNGMTFSLIAARLIRDLVSGRTPELADLFALTRVQPA
jgi:glycine/D-amino acid oxidase-like deaminating enzyme